MILWPDAAKATLVDHGFTAFCEYAHDNSMSLRDELGEKGLCDPADSLEIKEGVPCPTAFTPVAYSSLWNLAEDPLQPMLQNSFFAQYCNVCVEDICRGCNADTKFVMASADDYCLKEYNPGVFYREMIVSKSAATFPEVSVATYEQVGYTSLIQTDALNLKSSKKKRARSMMVGYTTNIDQEPPSELVCAVAAGEDAFCTEWETATPVPIECVGATGINRPSSYAKFGFFCSGTHLAWRLYVEGLGGQFSLNSVAFKYNETAKKW
jgi:hypothetical protein